MQRPPPHLDRCLELLCEYVVDLGFVPEKGDHSHLDHVVTKLNDEILGKKGRIWKKSAVLKEFRWLRGDFRDLSEEQAKKQRIGERHLGPPPRKHTDVFDLDMRESIFNTPWNDGPYEYESLPTDEKRYSLKDFHAALALLDTDGT